MITPDIKKQLQEYSESMQEEVCAFIVEDANKNVRIEKVENKHPHPIHNFLINPLDYLNIKNKYQILYLFHSHFESDDFSEADIFYSKFHGLNMIMYNIKSKNFNFLTV